MDGLEYWNIVKNILKKLDDTVIWQSNIIPMYDVMINKFGLIDDELNIKIEDDNERHRVWELMHFYLQHTRIPKNNQEKPDIYRLYQIAYNVGQLNVP